MTYSAAQPSRQDPNVQANVAPQEVVKKVKELFYRCQYQNVIEQVDKIDWEFYDDKSYVDLQVLKSNALYETHEVEASKDLLKAMATFRHIQNRAVYLYANGRLNYFEMQFNEALDQFMEISAITTDPVLKFRGLLGAANVHYSLSNFEEIPSLLAQLDALKSKVGVEDQISHLIMLGNYYRSAGIDKIMARKYYALAMSQAAAVSWNYFLNRCLYGLATIEKEEGNQKELFCTLAILKAMLNGSESTYFNFLVNDKFKDDSFSITTSFELDQEHLRIRVGNTWHHFHEKPLLFNFIKAIFRKKGFVTKAELARTLWPDQKYLPRTHDPRIFDVAKRIRATIEKYENNPMVLISGRMGYKLAISESNCD